jgi:hypothetical protein
VAVSMEEMSGFQFLDIARKMHRNIQVICKCKVFIERIFWFFLYLCIAQYTLLE